MSNKITTEQLDKNMKIVSIITLIFGIIFSFLGLIVSKKIFLASIISTFIFAIILPKISRLLLKNMTGK